MVIYMPMIPQAIYTMLSCARIGAIHSLIFGGFASKELSSRIDHAKVSASFGGNQAVAMYGIAIFEDGSSKSDLYLLDPPFK